MAIEIIKSKTLEDVVEFINNHNIDHVWLYKNGIYIGSFLPKIFGKINYDLEKISITLFIKKDTVLFKEMVIIRNDDLSEYTFEFI